MAAQGQSIYAASGDSGAFDNGSTLSVDDPASQPYMTAAGGTTLTTLANQTYVKETAWWDPTRKIGGGGGISAVWPIPSWQVGAASAGAGARRPRSAMFRTSPWMPTPTRGTPSIRGAAGGV